MEKAVPRLWLVIFSSFVFCLLLFIANNSGLFGRNYQITSIVNNFAISIDSPKPEILNLTFKSPDSTQNEHRVNPAMKQSVKEEETVSIGSMEPETLNFTVDAGNATENEFKAKPEEEETILSDSPKPETLNFTTEPGNQMEYKYRSNTDIKPLAKEKETVLSVSPKPESLNLTVDAGNATQNEYRANSDAQHSVSIASPKSEILNIIVEAGNARENEHTANPVARHPMEEKKADSCAGRYIYVHDLPSKFNDDVIKNCRKLIKWFDMCPYMVNSGLGPQIIDNSAQVLSRTGSWFSTNQFLLEVIFREKMKYYECLTNDSSLASAIYIPFYAGFDISRHLWGYNITVRDKLAKELANWLSEKPEWRNMNGRDHFFVSGRIGWDFRRISDQESDWGNNLMLLPQFANTTMLTIETSPWSNEFAIPYPTYFHPKSKAEVHKWQRKVKKAKRSFLFSFIGAPRPKMEQSIRGEIIRQCLASQGNCKFLNCNSPVKDCDNPVKVMKVFQDSVFCLQPQGDSATRRSIFDSILAGCIPVFFHPASAYTQYIWYFPREYTKFSVYIPEDDVKNGRVSIEKLLLRVNRTEIVQMRNEVVRLIPKIIYGQPRPVGPEKIEDAFEIAVGRVLERVEKVRREFEEGRDPPTEFSKYRDLRKFE